MLDSSRFFAVRVVGDGGMKAVLGIGFEERGEAIDFGICLQECRKVLGLEPQNGAVKGALVGEKKEVKRDYGLKEGQTIKVDIGRRGRRKVEGESVGSEGASAGGEGNALFSIKPPLAPPPYGENDQGVAMPMLAPPPSAQEVRAEKRRSKIYFQSSIAPIYSSLRVVRHVA